jgi:hypothetical protein
MIEKVIVQGPLIEGLVQVSCRRVAVCGPVGGVPREPMTRHSPNPAMSDNFSEKKGDDGGMLFNDGH